MSNPQTPPFLRLLRMPLQFQTEMQKHKNVSLLPTSNSLLLQSMTKSQDNFFLQFLPSSYCRYYKVSQTDIHHNPLASSSSTNLALSSTAPVTSHMCEECVQRHLDDGVGGGGVQSHAPPPEEQLLLAPAIVVELPTYDEAIAEDR